MQAYRNSAPAQQKSIMASNEPIIEAQPFTDR